jgi:predicted DNA-binding WGR domain protein/uncharacterized protein YwqG
METQTWYLELSEENGSHKFYEVTLENTDLTVRYGRIGDTGQTQKKSFETIEKARVEAEKKLTAKRKSGYQDAELGQSTKKALAAKPKFNKLQFVRFTEVKIPITTPITKFGGQPVWLAEPRWPLSARTGHPIPFMCQIKLEPELFGTIDATIAYIFKDGDGDDMATVLQPGNIVARHDLYGQEGDFPLFSIQTNGSTLRKSISIQEPPFYQSVEVEYSAQLKAGWDAPYAFDDERENWSQEKENRTYSKTIGYKIGGSPCIFDDEFVPEELHEKWNLLLQMRQPEENEDESALSDYFGEVTCWWFISKDGKQLTFSSMAY